MLERCTEAMAAAGCKASTNNRDISQIGSIYSRLAMPLNDDSSELGGGDSTKSADLADPSLNAGRGELCRLILAHKSDLGLEDKANDDIIAQIDDIVSHLWMQCARAAYGGDAKFAERFSWLVEAFERL